MHRSFEWRTTPSSVEKMHLTGQTAAQGASVQCMQAMETERSPGLPSLMVTTRFGFLHAGYRIESIGGERVHALAEYDRIGTFRIFAALVDALEPAGKMVWHPGHAFADARCDQRFHLRFRVVLGSEDPDPAAVLDAALGRIRRIDLDEHVLLQLGQPLVGARLLAAALVVDQPAGGQNQRELFD